MAKRSLGIGKTSKSKKQKPVPQEEEKNQEKQVSARSNEITVELNEEADANDEIAQLKALWKTYLISEKDNELVLNGIIHECDRLLRSSELGEKKETEQFSVELPDFFHSIYALALAELAKFHTEDNKQVAEYFEAAVERVDLGLDQHQNSIQLLFSKSKILLHQIALQYISQLKVDTSISKKVPKLSPYLDSALRTYEEAEKRADELKKYDLFNTDQLEILQVLDDLLDIVDNFGKDITEGEDDEEDDEEDEIEFEESHPLYAIRESDEYNQWWRDHIILFLENVDKHGKEIGVDFKDKVKSQEDEHTLLPLRREICKRIGQSYLQEAEIPSSVFTTLAYDDGFKNEKEINGLSLKESQKVAQKLISTALKYLQWAEDQEEPETWVDVAEAMISLGNLYEVESEEQENHYQKAEKILNKANNVTNGKYEDVLENLLGD